jgi:hypothetical protein
VVEDVGLRVEHEVDMGEVALEVGREDLDRGMRIAVTDRPDGRGPDAGAAVGEFIARHAGDDAVTEIHRGHGLGDAGGLAEVELGRAPGRDGAEGARAGADVAQDHQGRGPARPAFAEVGALRALADRVQPMFADQPVGGHVTGAAREPGAEPGRFARGLG